MSMPPLPPWHLQFLGTAGARFSVLRQRRASGGLWLSLDGIDWAVDPGPGSLVRMHQSPFFRDPEQLEGILLTHRHIDHSGDMNILAEAMTRGGTLQRGQVILPEDAVFNPEPVFFGYLRRKTEKNTYWSAGKTIPLGKGAHVEGVRLIHHGVDCFGFRAWHPRTGYWGLISDTRFFPGLQEAFKGCGLLILNVTLQKSRDYLDHLSLEEARDIIHEVKPELALITHMGTQILKNGPEELICPMSTPEIRVFPAQDGMVVDLEHKTILRDCPEMPLPLGDTGYSLV